METVRRSSYLHDVRTLYDVGSSAGLTDVELLARFTGGVGQAAELAFSALVERHGPMVLRVCRSVLPPQDAQDAFQATFLVLARRAGSIRKGESLASWLHGVACRTAACRGSPRPGGRGLRGGPPGRRQIPRSTVTQGTSPRSFTRNSGGSPRSIARRSCCSTWRV